MDKEENQQPPLSKEDKRLAALDNVKRKAGDFHALFTSPIGEKVLEYLEDEFNKDEIFTAGESDTTAYKLGSRDVIIYIRQMIRLKENARKLEG